jgi:hypothetical protein
MGAKSNVNDEIHLLRGAVIAVIALSDAADSDQMKLAVDLLLAGLRRSGRFSKENASSYRTRSTPAKRSYLSQRHRSSLNRKILNLAMQILKALRTFLRRFLQFSREFPKLNHRLPINNKHCADMFMGLRMMKPHFVKPSVALSAEAQSVLGVANAQLAHCRSTDVVLDAFWRFLNQ